MALTTACSPDSRARDQSRERLMIAQLRDHQIACNGLYRRPIIHPPRFHMTVSRSRCWSKACAPASDQISLAQLILKHTGYCKPNGNRQQRV
jgi:hypothetical protein